MEPIPLFVRFRSLFARDRAEFWFDHFTDEEKKLSRLDVWGLAKVINEARVRNVVGDAEKLIVAEHMLNVRLAKIQASAQWGAGVLGFVGAIIGASLTVALTTVMQSSKETKLSPECDCKTTAVAVPVQQADKLISQLPKNNQINLGTAIAPSAVSIENRPNKNSEKKQPNAGTNP